MGCSANDYILINRSVFAVQGGHFFMYLMISFTATKTIAKESNNITSIIFYTPPLLGSQNNRRRSFTVLLYHNSVTMYIVIMYKYYVHSLYSLPIDLLLCT